MFSDSYDDVGGQQTWGDTAQGVVEAFSSVGSMIKGFVGKAEAPRKFQSSRSMPGFGPGGFQSNNNFNSGGFNSPTNGFGSNSPNSGGFNSNWTPPARSNSWRKTSSKKKKSSKKKGKKKRKNSLDDFFSDSESEEVKQKKKTKKKKRKSKKKTDWSDADDSSDTESEEEVQVKKRKSRRRSKKKKQIVVESSDDESSEFSDVVAVVKKSKKEKNKKVPLKKKQKKTKSKVIKKKLTVGDSDYSDESSDDGARKRKKKKKAPKKSKKDAESEKKSEKTSKEKAEELPNLLDLGPKKDSVNLLDELTPTKSGSSRSKPVNTIDDIFSITKSNDNLLTSPFQGNMMMSSSPSILPQTTQNRQPPNNLFSTIHSPPQRGFGGNSPQMRGFTGNSPQQRGFAGPAFGQQGMRPAYGQQTGFPQQFNHSPTVNSSFMSSNASSQRKVQKKTTRNLDFRSAMSSEHFSLGAGPETSIFGQPSRQTFI